MSLDFAFWKYSDDGQHDHNLVYDAVMNNVSLDYVAPLPIELIRKQIADVFDPIMQREDDGWENQDGAFMLETKHNFVLFACTHSINTDYVNMMIDIMKEFECPLYDPQTETRYEL